MATDMESYMSFEKDLEDYATFTEKLLTLIRTKPVDTELGRDYLDKIYRLFYTCMGVRKGHVLDHLCDELCKNVQPFKSNLTISICKFLSSLVDFDFISSSKTFSTCLSWMRDVLVSYQTEMNSDVLKFLKSILFAEQFKDINTYLPFLLGEDGLFIKYLEPANAPDVEVGYYIAGCLEGILVYNYKGNGLEEKYIHRIKDIILNIASANLCKGYLIYPSKVLILCLHVLYIIIVNKLIPNSSDFTGEILGMVQASLFHGLAHYPCVKPKLLRPAAMNLPERIHVVPKCKNLKDHKVKSSKKTAAHAKNNIRPISKQWNLAPIESETSATKAAYCSRVRQQAVRLLQAFIENSRSQDIFGYWTQIVATGLCTDARVLTRSIIIEENDDVKQTALSTLTQLLIDAKPFLMHAENVQRESFITFFGSVCLIIKELHFSLDKVLIWKTNVNVLTQALKCLVALIHGTPYARIRPMLIIEILKRCKSYISHEDPMIQVGALSVFEAAASCDPMMPEIIEMLAERITSDAHREMVEEVEVDIEDIENSSSQSADEEQTSRKNGICFLLDAALKNISSVHRQRAHNVQGNFRRRRFATANVAAVHTYQNLNVRLQSLKLIGRMAFNTPSLVYPNLLKVLKELKIALRDPEVQVVLHTLRTLEIMATYLAKSNSNDYYSRIFWPYMFSDILKVVAHSQTIIREAACDCLGTFRGALFEELRGPKKLLIITVLFGAVRDEESAVRAAALRALGMWVTFPTMEKETCFLMDLADIVCHSVDDENLGIRVKGVWAMANLCDCLIKHKDCEDVEPLPFELILPKLYNVSVKASEDSDKVKCNAVRALGSILYLCSEKNILNDTSSALDALINCARLKNDMKVSWNACRALGVILGHHPDRILPSSWRDQVFPALCNLICSSPNFKVRTNAAWALNACESYGKYTITLWKSIALALENSQHMSSYVEYPHQDALVQQLCVTLSHVAACTKASELQNLWAEISDHVEDITGYMRQLQENILLEKIGDLIKAKSELESHAKTAKTAEDRQIAQTLAEIFDRTKYYNLFDRI